MVMVRGGVVWAPRGKEGLAKLHLTALVGFLTVPNLLERS